MKISYKYIFKDLLINFDCIARRMLLLLLSLCTQMSLEKKIYLGSEKWQITGWNSDLTEALSCHTWTLVRLPFKEVFTH